MTTRPQKLKNRHKKMTLFVRALLKTRRPIGGPTMTHSDKREKLRRKAERRDQIA